MPPKGPLYPTAGTSCPEEAEHRQSIVPCVADGPEDSYAFHIVVPTPGDPEDPYTFRVVVPTPENPETSMSEKQATRAVLGVVENGVEKDS